MEYKGYVPGLQPLALKGKRIVVPKGTFIKVIDLPIKYLQEVDAKLRKHEGHLTQNEMVQWRDLGGPLTSFMQCTTIPATKDIEIYNACLVNGNVVHKIIFHATFGEDRALLFELQGENYILSSPGVAWPSEDGKKTYYVEATDVPELLANKYETVVTPIPKMSGGNGYPGELTKLITISKKR